jgi:peptidoglycan/LPS O-acetylase OafA/YrhL
MAIGYLIDVLKIKDRVISFINKSGSIMGKYSYPLYISHYTVLFIFSNLIHNVLLYVVVSLPIILLIAYSLENWFQPAVMSYFKKKKQPDTLIKEHDLRLPLTPALPVRAEGA